MTCDLNFVWNALGEAVLIDFDRSEPLDRLKVEVCGHMIQCFVVSGVKSLLVSVTVETWHV